MKPLSRRSVTTSMVAAVAAVPAVALSVRSAPRDDKLLAVIRRYESELAALNASRGLTDEELDAWVDRTDAILVEAAGLPALTAASALAALDLVATEGQVDSHSIYGERFLELVRAAGRDNDPPPKRELLVLNPIARRGLRVYSRG
jgi:hypothetical protein